MIKTPRAYHAYVESELKRIAFECQQDAYERAQEALGRGDRLPRLVPNEMYDAGAQGDIVTISLPSETPVAALVREIRGESPASKDAA